MNALKCPLCPPGPVEIGGNDLSLNWTHAVALYDDDTDETLTAENAAAWWWEVRCPSYHVVATSTAEALDTECPDPPSMARLLALAGNG